MMQRFLVLYAGPTKETARQVALINDSKTIQAVAKAALRNLTFGPDPALRAMAVGKREALKSIISEGNEK